VTYLLKTAGFVAILVISTTAAVILGNEYADTLRVRVTSTPPLVDGGSMFVYIDEVTGCHYLRPVGATGTLVPRMAGDGARHFGCGGPTGRQSDLAVNRR